jgi:hypothetical protein
MINQLKRFFFSAIITTSLIAAPATDAAAETYQAGKFTITLDDGENGKTYRGCDVQNQCINLENGTSWRDGGYRGITWENGSYTYAVSWPESSDTGMYLNIYNRHKRIFHRQLVPLTKGAVSVDYLPASVGLQIK